MKSLYGFIAITEKIANITESVAVVKQNK